MKQKAGDVAYPKTFHLKDGTVVELRLMTKDDLDALLTFFRGLPEEDRMFLKEDVTEPSVVQTWIRRLDYDSVIPILAFIGDDLVGDATLHMQSHGWMRHVGEIRIVVSRVHQRKGIGTLLARELFYNAVRRGLSKIEALAVEDQMGAIKSLQKLGFKQEGLLKDYVLDMKGRKHNLIVLTHNTDELWKRMEDMILDGDLFLEHH
jgi:RimJ/RimL family protein N-acetyltransferase